MKFLRLIIVISCIGLVVSIISLKTSAQTTTKKSGVNTFNEGIKKYAAGNYRGAITDFTKAIEQEPKNAGAYVNRSAAKSMLNDHEGALADAEKALSLTPANNKAVRSAACIRKAVVFLSQQRFTESIKQSDLAIQANPKSDEAFVNRAIANGLLNNFQIAIQDLDRALQLNPQYAYAYHLRGDYKRMLKNTKASIADYTKAITLNPAFVNSYINRGAMRAEAQDLKGAAEDFTKITQLTPDNLAAWLNRGLVYFQLKDFKAAIKDFDAVIRRDSGSMHAYQSRAASYHALGEYNNAIKSYTEALRRNPQDIKAFLNSTTDLNVSLNQKNFTANQLYLSRGEARAQIGDTVGACKDLQKAFKLGNQTAYQNISFYCNNFTSLFIPDPKFPKPLQLYPREADDSAVVELAGTVNGALHKNRFDTVYIQTFKNGQPLNRMAHFLEYAQSSRASVSLRVKIHAELSEYSFRLGVKNNLQDTIITTVDSVVCGDVFLVSGQSNVVLGSTWQHPRKEYARTANYGHGDNIWAVANAGNEDQIGGVGALALQIQYNILEQYQIPVCVINGGMSGSTIEQHLRPKELYYGFALYGRLFIRAQEANVISKAKGLIWYQGESNSVPGYFESFVDLHKTWKEDYSGLKKIYVVQIRPSSCGKKDQDTLREIQRGFDGFSKVVMHSSNGIGYFDGCHYETNGYKMLGSQLFQLIARDFYSSTDTLGIQSPNLVKAFYSSPSHDEITLLFNSATTNTINIPADTVINGTPVSINDYISLDGQSGVVESIRPVNNTLVIKLKRAIKSQRISYLPNMYYHNTTTIYNGPWLTTQRGVGVLSFHQVPILPFTNK